MGTFGQMKDMYKLQKQAKEIKKKLKNIHIEAEENGVTITLNGEQEVISVKINDEAMKDKGQLEKSILSALQKGLKKAQEIAAVNMKDIMGQMGLDLPGGADAA
ncbi:MAG: YbaB/EbfC family nucleoid-associated protein [Candidatus Peregrinibacteria bacterium]|nr:YbaB/EbfC family nucleoid-associated protein [Candidatus Peregrinibacteria bacterium]